jgi:hypothetical protein
VKTSLHGFFPIAEATPFSSQSVSINAGSTMADSASKDNLEFVEDLLHKIMAAQDNQQLNKIINKFLVDITPFMG